MSQLCHIKLKETKLLSYSNASRIFANILSNLKWLDSLVINNNSITN